MYCPINLRGKEVEFIGQLVVVVASERREDVAVSRGAVEFDVDRLSAELGEDFVGGLLPGKLGDAVDDVGVTGHFFCLWLR